LANLFAFLNSLLVTSYDVILCFDIVNLKAFMVLLIMGKISKERRWHADYCFTLGEELELMTCVEGVS